jgi:hypothetical protein
MRGLTKAGVVVDVSSEIVAPPLELCGSWRLISLLLAAPCALAMTLALVPAPTGWFCEPADPSFWVGCSDGVDPVFIPGLAAIVSF